jgi:DNA-binding MarR family transcriptional regulator
MPDFHHIHHRSNRFFAQGKVLAAILRTGPTTQGELLEILSGDPQSLGEPRPLDETLSELEKRKLITRGEGPHGTDGENKRGDIFSLTKRGEVAAKKFQNFNRHAERFFSQGKVLAAILREGSAMQSELLEAVGGDPARLSEIVSELEKQRSIKRSEQRRENSAEGGEVFSLTKTGELKARRFQIHDLFTRNITESLSDEEQGQLTAIIEKLRLRSGGEASSHFHFRGEHFHFGGRGDR